MLPVLQATQARLDALEADNDAGDALAADSDDEEVVIESDDEGARGQGWQLRVGEARKASRCMGYGFSARCGMCIHKVARTCLHLTVSLQAVAVPLQSLDLVQGSRSAL